MLAMAMLSPGKSGIRLSTQDKKAFGNDDLGRKEGEEQLEEPSAICALYYLCGLCLYVGSITFVLGSISISLQWPNSERREWDACY